MALNLEGLDLSEEVLAKINEQNAGLVSASEIEGLKKNRDDLLAEKKAVQDAKTLAEQKAEAEHLAALQKDKDFEALSKSYKDKLAEYEKRDKLNAEKLQKQAVSTKALEMAKTISEGDNADLLATFIESRLRSDGGEIKVTDANGALTISSQEDLLNEFKANQRYASLVTVTKADGGRTAAASNGHSSASSSKKAYSDMTLKEQIEYNSTVNPVRN